MCLKLPGISFRKLQHKVLDISAEIAFPICQDYADCFVFLPEKILLHLMAVTGQSVSSFPQGEFLQMLPCKL